MPPRQRSTQKSRRPSRDPSFSPPAGAAAASARPAALTRELRLLRSSLNAEAYARPVSDAELALRASEEAAASTHAESVRTKLVLDRVGSRLRKEEISESDLEEIPHVKGAAAAAREAEATREAAGLGPRFFTGTEPRPSRLPAGFQTGADSPASAPRLSRVPFASPPDDSPEQGNRSDSAYRPSASSSRRGRRGPARSARRAPTPPTPDEEVEEEEQSPESPSPPPRRRSRPPQRAPAAAAAASPVPTAARADPAPASLRAPTAADFPSPVIRAFLPFPPPSPVPAAAAASAAPVSRAPRLRRIASSAASPERAIIELVSSSEESPAAKPARRA
jgi:hypothetical protein